MQGILNVDSKNNTITAKSGTKLFRYCKAIYRHNMALPNQGDINKQSLAGALSTGTHGTGITLKSMSNQILKFKLITGNAELIDIDIKNSPKILKAFAVSFGSVGLITEATLQLMPAYKLKVDTWAEDMCIVLEHVHRRLKENRHLEMFYFPIGDWSIVKTMNITDKKPSLFNKLNKINDIVFENWLYESLVKSAPKLRAHKTFDKLMRKTVNDKTFVNWSHHAFPTERNVRFMEMEYNLPLTKFEEVFAEMKASIQQNNFQTLFPIEIRFVKGDDLWLSPAYKRDSVYFAVHSYIKEDFRPYFNEMERIFKRHNGRPHWGKWHSLKKNDLERIYPKWHDFLKLRSEFDPQGLFLNEYLKSILM